MTRLWTIIGVRNARRDLDGALGCARLARRGARACPERIITIVEDEG